MDFTRNLFQILPNQFFSVSRKTRQDKWGITCPEGCRCFDQARLRIVEEARYLDKLLGVRTPPSEEFLTVVPAISCPVPILFALNAPIIVAVPCNVRVLVAGVPPIFKKFAPVANRDGQGRTVYVFKSLL